MSNLRFLPPAAAFVSAVAMGERPSRFSEVPFPPLGSVSPAFCSELPELFGVETQEESRTVLSAATSSKRDARRRLDAVIGRFTERPSSRERSDRPDYLTKTKARLCE